MIRVKKTKKYMVDVWYVATVVVKANSVEEAETKVNSETKLRQEEAVFDHLITNEFTGK